MHILITHKNSAQIKEIKQKEFLNDKNRLIETNQDEETFFKTPQVFIYELLKFAQKGQINDADLIDQIDTMIVGVRTKPNQASLNKLKI